MAIKQHGLDRILKNLNQQISNIEGANEQGLLQAALLIKREAQEKTPVDTGNLKNSAYTDSEGGNNPAAVIGYQASYAPFVHEDLEARHDNGEAKFLEKAVNENQDRIPEIIRRRAKV
mgnify:CR=1 FL=1